LFVDSCPRFSR